MCSLAALFHVLPRALGMDYLGVIVGILAFLITLLLGWNIYTVVDFQNRDKEVKQLKETLATALKLLNSNNSISNAKFSEELADIHKFVKSYDLDSFEDKYISYKLYAISFYSTTSDHQHIIRISKELETYIANNKVSNHALNDIISYHHKVDDKFVRQTLQKLSHHAESLLSSQS